MKFILRTLAVLALLTLWALPQTVTAASSAVIIADAKSDICNGIATAGGGCGGSTGTSLNKVLTFALNTLSLIAGIAAVIMIMVSGFKYITSNGDSGSIASAKTTLIYAIVGLVVVALSQIIVKFVLKKVS
jgi:hypothetical protein